MSDYDQQSAEAYLGIDDRPYVMHVERPSVMALVQPAGKRILDYGCGSGKYCRWTKSAGAAQVLGVDTSADQIMIAGDMERSKPGGIEYRLIEPDEAVVFGQFDWVIAIWVVIVAQTPAQVRPFFERAYENLVSGGNFLMWTSLVPDDEAGRQQFCDAYAADDIHFTIEPNTREPVTTALQVDDFRTTNYFYSFDTYRQLLEECGFGAVRFAPASVVPAQDARWRKFAQDTGMGAVLASKT